MPSRKKDEAARWFQQALYDLKAVQWNVDGGFYDTACFLAQQAAERALKSFLYYTGARRAALLTHSLVAMVRDGKKSLAAMRELLPEARELDLHYIPSRYPNGLPSGYPHQFYEKPVADRAYVAAKRIVSLVCRHYQDQGERSILEPEEEP
ncbi:MAG TPA: HEPN domain-containing protein [Acidobacteriota bacterium]|jgi:HEPN domain-containing protein|nr:HEPN domain-containing protein [Acidobacteriota bacterium]